MCPSGRGAQYKMDRAPDLLVCTPALRSGSPGPSRATTTAGVSRTLIRTDSATGAVFTGRRTISRTTATCAAFPQCTSYSIRPLYPAIQGKRRLPRPNTRVRRPLLVTIKGGGRLPLRGAGLSHTLDSGFSFPRGCSGTTKDSSQSAPLLSRDLGASLPLSPWLYPLLQALRVQNNTVPLHTPFDGRTAPRPEPG